MPSELTAGAGLVLVALLLGAPGTAAARSCSIEGQDAAPRVVLETTHGMIVLELNPEKAPITVANFLDYVDRGWYDGTIFHRVRDDFMIQGGGFDARLQKKITRPPIKNEADNALLNDRGSVAMARTDDPDSATAQFFINLFDNTFLNREEARDGFGYAVFGKVVEGMDVVDAIAAVEVNRPGQLSEAQPVNAVVIKRIKRQ